MFLFYREKSEICDIVNGKWKFSEIPSKFVISDDEDKAILRLSRNEDFYDINYVMKQQKIPLISRIERVHTHDSVCDEYVKYCGCGGPGLDETCCGKYKACHCLCEVEEIKKEIENECLRYFEEHPEEKVPFLRKTLKYFKIPIDKIERC